MASFLLLFALISPSQAQDAFGKPGLVPNWSSAKKVQVGTYYEKESAKSPLWFTLAHGILTEVFYPQIDKPQLKDSQFIVVSPEGKVLDEKTSFHHEVVVVSPSMIKMINRAKDVTISHLFYTSKNSALLVDQVEIATGKDGFQFYLLTNPHLNNSGLGDNGVARENLEFFEGETKLNVSSDLPFVKTSVGYVGRSDGFQDLIKDGQMDWTFKKALHGNIAGMGKFAFGKTKGKTRLKVFYNFSGSPENDSGLFAYERSWEGYLKSLSLPKTMTTKEKLLYMRSLYTIKVHADKKNPGAMAASLSKPWGEKTYDDGKSFSGGYHLTWPRDLFHKSLALLLSGDFDSAIKSLRFLKKIQYKSGTWFYNPRIISRKGAFPQNVWTNGEEYWSGFQLDQVGYPIQLAYHLYKRLNNQGQRKFMSEFGLMISNAAKVIQTYGPWSAQERWEENFGISPSTFSVATAALKMASELLNDPSLEELAHTWLTKPNDNIHTWTFTKNGLYPGGEYYVRVSGCENYIGVWNPNEIKKCHIANSSMKKDQREVLDQGFLKLSLMGLVPADDERILKSLKVINQNIRVKTPHGFGWYRYTFDSYGYGEGQKGRLWPLLNGEHGRYYLELYRSGAISAKTTRYQVNETLKTIYGFANEGLMIPEQVWEKTGEGTGAATPLAWSHAEYIKLLWSRSFGLNVENVWELYEQN